ncbi:putative membrane protein [Cesiribacter andamanensis]|uniref:Putative membrane protein n=1 Tax=Cesiribacter andamanensis AMV16 TaxID=1279009 RepID=M7N442_9BACT|nr:putative membrane protein [Cesiribacter andamanensis]EMR02062.1 putative membrane protein [Cesiribacter andamanensis AMV16]
MSSTLSSYTPLLLLVLLAGFSACDGSSSGPERSPASGQDSIAIREATDPVPEPPTRTDSSNAKAPAGQGTVEPETSLYRITGTEPFWSLTIAKPYSIYRSMEGDSLAFAYQDPSQAEGRQQGWAQHYPLGEGNWLLLRRGNTPCSDGMSDKEWTYTATLWLNSRLLDGCGEAL